MPHYGVLLVGGNRTHQEGYGRSFAGDPRCKVVAVSDEAGIPEYRAGLNRLLAHEMGVPYIADLEAALARRDVQVVSMCADVERRGRVGVMCAQAGKHIYFDKPLAGSARDARAIADAVERAGVHSQMFSQISTPWAQAAKSAIASGQLGDIVGWHADMLMAKGRPGTAPQRNKPRAEQPRPERFTFVEAKREMLDMGVYSVSMVLWLSGRRASAVYATTGNYFFSEHAAHDIEDFGALTLTLDDGRVATATGGRIGWTSHPRSGVVRVIVTGARGSAVFSEATPRLEIYSDEPPFTLPPTHPWDPMAMWSSTGRDLGTAPKRQWVSMSESPQSVDMRGFIDCLDRDVEPEMNARTAVHHVEVIMAGYESAAAGKPVSLRVKAGVASDRAGRVASRRGS
ncbi:MAG: Gfo/Idh/MocA family oxidoreductase [Chloroflexi bacterium]|nr:Gfo/Idh/MocA family oxidoreductase [Chloroflexota bacterium]